MDSDHITPSDEVDSAIFLDSPPPLPCSERIVIGSSTGHSQCFPASKESAFVAVTFSNDTPVATDPSITTEQSTRLDKQDPTSPTSRSTDLLSNDLSEEPVSDVHPEVKTSPQVIKEPVPSVHGDVSSGDAAEVSDLHSSVQTELRTKEDFECMASAECSILLEKVNTADVAVQNLKPKEDQVFTSTAVGACAVTVSGEEFSRPKAEVAEDTSMDARGVNDKLVQIKPPVRSRAIQTHAPAKTKGLQIGSGLIEPRRKRRRVVRRSFALLSSSEDEGTIPAMGDEHQSGTSKRGVTHTDESSQLLSDSSKTPRSKGRRAKKKRVLDEDQVLDQISPQLIEACGTEPLALTVYDRVTQICTTLFQDVSEWLADGFPKCFEICSLITQPTKLVIWLAKRRLIANTTECPKCKVSMYLKSARIVRHFYKWTCKKCGRKLSIRRGSMFIKAGVSEANIILILYLWSVGYPMEFIGTEIETAFTSVRWYVWLALKSCASELRRNFEPLSGIVEVEWDSFMKSTATREALSLLCGIERSTEKCFAVRCPKNTDKQSLRQLLQRNIAPGSIIITRDLPIYNELNLRTLGYHHYVLDQAHDLALDDIVIDLHLIEGFVETIKSFIRKQGGPGIFCKEIFLAEVVIRRMWGTNLLPMVFYCISRAYDIS